MAGLTQLEQLLMPAGQRQPCVGYFVLLTGADAAEMEIIRRVSREAVHSGALIAGRMANPTGAQLQALQGVLPAPSPTGAAAIAQDLRAWLKALQPAVASRLAELLWETLSRKSEAARRNCYIKWLIWLHDDLRLVLPLLGMGRMPKLVYVDTAITPHEAELLQAVWRCGADVLILALNGDDGYTCLPPSVAQRLTHPGQHPFPPELATADPEALQKALGIAQNRPDSVFGNSAFGIKKIQSNQSFKRPDEPKSVSAPVPQQPPKPVRTPARPVRQEDIDPYRYFEKPRTRILTNVWLTEATAEAALIPMAARGVEADTVYQTMILVHGVEDALSWEQDMCRLRQRLLAQGRRLLILDDQEPEISATEISAVRRRTYRSPQEMVVDLAANLPRDGDAELTRLAQHAFVEVALSLAAQEKETAAQLRLLVCLLCMIRRHHTQLFAGGGSTLPCVIALAGTLDPVWALYLRFLAGLPVDVLIICPCLELEPGIQDSRLLLLKRSDSLRVTRFPTADGSIRVSTAAAQAERELDSLLHTQAGSYRPGQFSRADTVVLRTTYDEISILWQQELQYRSGFQVTDGLVTMPVLFARISGVEGGRALPYWQQLKRLVLPGSIFAPRLPMIQPGQTDVQLKAAGRALHGTTLDTDRLRSDPAYPFGHLRKEMQQHMLRQLQWMLDQRLIAGTGINGMEHKVVSTVLSLKSEVLQQVQSFDFTRQSPKAIVVHTGEGRASAEDAIILSFLSLVGFDVLFFTPTGYQGIEPWLTARYPVEHRIGDYMYNLTVPDFSKLPEQRAPWLKNWFRRG